MFKKKGISEFVQREKKMSASEKRRELNEQERPFFIRMRQPQLAGGGTHQRQPDEWRDRTFSAMPSGTLQDFQKKTKKNIHKQKYAVTSLNLVMVHLHLEEVKTDELLSS